MICRIFSSPNAPKEIHVHDDPYSLVDAQRNADNGWKVYMDCQLPETPFIKGDSKPSFNTVIDNVRRL